MISSYEHTINGKRHLFKFSTRALVSIEREYDTAITTLMQGLEEDPRFSVMVGVLSYIANDGAGISEDEAFALVDEVGLDAVGEIIGGAVELAFPQEAAAEKKKPRSRSR